MRLRLIQPSERYAPSYIEGLHESLAQNPKATDLQDQIDHLSDHMKWWRENAGRRKRSERRFMYWLVDGRDYLGLAQVRLTPSGRDPRIRSHLYYEVRPSRRGEGLGTKLFTLTLRKAQELGIRPVLVCVERGNAPSRRIIEQAGGMLLRTVPLRSERTTMLMYEFRDLPKRGRH